MSQSETLAKTSPKVGIVLSSTLAEWASCRTIGANLLRAYQSHLGDGFISYDYNKHLDFDQMDDLAKRIISDGVTHLHFLDHLPHPLALISNLIKRSPDRLPNFVFHVYGDFTYYSPEWTLLLYLLRKYKSHFICASDRQVKLVERLIQTPKAAISRCPFPVDTEFYQYSDSARKQGREKFKVDSDELVILYTGRMSMQKNVTMAIRETFEFFAKKKKRIKFLAAGSFDDLGAPFFGVYPARGYEFQALENLRMSIPVHQGSVHWIGSLDSEDLRLAYNAADLFISLSMHHDEDFGMSPAEALACGLPSVLSDWGGYSNFAKVGGRAYLVPVKTDRQGFYFAKKDMQKALSSAYNLHLKNTRSEKMTRFADSIGIDGVAKNIIANVWDRECHQVKGPFDRLVKLAERLHLFREHKQNHLFKGYREPFYVDLYKPYFE